MNSFLVFQDVALFQGSLTQEPVSNQQTDYSTLYVIFIAMFIAVCSAVCLGVWWLLKTKDSGNKGLNLHKNLVEQPAQEIMYAPVPPQVGNKSQGTTVSNSEVQSKAARPAIFISYRRQDSSDVTGRIYDRLTQHFGKDAVFKDVDSIPLGTDFRKHLGASVGQCDVLLAIIGKQWLAEDTGKRRLLEARDLVRIEMEAALQRDIPVVPVLVQGASVPGEEDLPETLQSLAYRNGIAVRPDPDFHQDMDRLIRGIEGYLKR